MSQEHSRVVCIACSVFRDELESLRTAGEFTYPVHYLDSVLHGNPTELRRRIERHMNDERERDNEVLLLYGDCHAHMANQASMPGVERVRGLNCPEILLGRDEYRRLRREGVFFLIPEWTRRFREIMRTQLGMDDETTKAFMSDMHTKLLYLDTGLTPVPTADLEMASECTGLPWDVKRVTCDHMKTAIEEAIERIA